MAHDKTWWRTQNTKPMADRQIDQLIGLAGGIVADGIVNQAEAEMLMDWLRANQMTENLHLCRLDEDEARALHDALIEWTGNSRTAGEELTTASLPLDPEPRAVQIAGQTFVFTGTGVFGTRKAMRDVTIRAGGAVKNAVTRRTQFLVLGTYVTSSWAHESFGRKIEKAMDYRDRALTGLRIVHEQDWMVALDR